MPRWVKISLIALAALIALVVVLKIAGIGGEHGPGRHVGNPSEHRPPPGIDHGP